VPWVQNVACRMSHVACRDPHFDVTAGLTYLVEQRSRDMKLGLADMRGELGSLAVRKRKMNGGTAKL
jgi:hypothetical protein